MTALFVYRPHVHERGIVATPDILIDGAALAAGGVRWPLPVDRLTTAGAIQVVGGGTLADAALLLVGTAGGMLVGVASDHRGPDPDGGRLACAKPICREAWRYTDIDDHLDALTLRCIAWAERGPPETVQEGCPAALAVETDFAQGRMLLRTGLPVAAASRAAGYEIVLEDPVLERRIALRYDVVELARWVG